jgi:CRP-like cAMP-binding protein
MSLKEEVDILRAIPLFSKIEPAKLKLLAFTSQRLTYAPGDELCRQGEPGDSAFIILDGDANVEIDTPAGRVTVAKVARNAVIGEIAILCDVPRTATVIAATDLAALRVSKDGFFHLVNQFPQIGVEVMHELASRLHHTTQALTTARARLNELDRAAGVSNG